MPGLRERQATLESLRKHRRHMRKRDWHGCNDYRDREKYRHCCKRLGIAQRKYDDNIKHGHYTGIRYLLKKYDIVVIPKFGYNGCAWQHYRFRQRLIDTVGCTADKTVCVVGEPGTSKTCGACGHWDSTLTLANRIYKCTDCGVHMDRDVNGARNNLLAATTISILKTHKA